MENLFGFFLENRSIIFIVILSIFLGIEVISHVPAILHTPLMSGANAIHGVVIIGAIIVMGHAETTGAMILGFLAVVLGTIALVAFALLGDRCGLWLVRGPQTPQQLRHYRVVRFALVATPIVIAYNSAERRMERGPIDRGTTSA